MSIVTLNYSDILRLINFLFLSALFYPQSSSQCTSIFVEIEIEIDRYNFVNSESGIDASVLINSRPSIVIRNSLSRSLATGITCRIVADATDEQADRIWHGGYNAATISTPLCEHNVVGCINVRR